MCLYELSIVDDTLEMLGTSKNYQQLRKWIFIMISGWIVSSFFWNIIDSIWFNHSYFSISRICVPFVANFLVHINTLGALTWAIILRSVSTHIYIFRKSTKGLTIFFKLLLHILKCFI